MSCKVVHFEIMGKDGAKLGDFYSSIFGWEINADNPMNYGMVEAQGEGSIGGGVGQAEEGAPAHATFYIEVDNAQAYLDRIEKAGGKTVVPVTEIPDMVTFALFQDPEGNMVGIVQAQ